MSRSTAGSELTASRRSFLGRTAATAAVAGGAAMALGPSMAGAASIASYETAHPWEFFVEDSGYGAVGDGRTDDTSAIQRCINDAATYANTNGFARVLFGAKTYAISGGQTSGGSGQGQLVLPYKSNNCTLELVGAGPCIPIMYGSEKTGTMLLSTTNPSPSGYSESPSVLYCANNGSGFNELSPVVRNLTIRQPGNPTKAAIHFWHASKCLVEYVTIEATPSGGAVVEPTNASGEAIVLPAIGNHAMIGLNTIEIMGHWTGLKIGEHTVGDNVSIYRCKIAIGTQNATHASRFGRLNVEHCPYVISGSTSGVVASPAHPLVIDTLDIENANNVSDWANKVRHVNDGNNALGATITYVITDANTGARSALDITGGSGITTKRLL